MATETSASSYEALRLGMVNGQLRTGAVVDQEVLAAFLEVPRERFVPKNLAELAYLDRSLPARGAKARRLLAPMTLARIIQATAVKQGERVLDVGGGSGYGAAILARMGAKVVLLESDPGAAAAAGQELAGKAVEVVKGALNEGVPAKAPFDVIVIEGAFRILPKTLFGQLAEGGRLAGVDAVSGASKIVLFERTGDALSRRAIFEVGADLLDGFLPAVSFAF